MMSLQAARLDAGAVRRPADLLGGPHCWRVASGGASNEII
jgi:hypothetical protein